MWMTWLVGVPTWNRAVASSILELLVVEYFRYKRTLYGIRGKSDGNFQLYDEINEFFCDILCIFLDQARKRNVGGVRKSARHKVCSGEFC